MCFLDFRESSKASEDEDGWMIRNRTHFVEILSSLLESQSLQVIHLNMEDTTRNVNSNFNADALLPPRKRLLAGLKRQNFDPNSPSPSKDDTSFNNPFIAQLSNSNLLNEDIVESSRITAIEAAKIAAAARAKAEEKAAKAAKAFSAARNALDLVATLSEEAAKNGKCLNSNKMKKHTNVEGLYNKKNKGCATNSRTDEELARNLHRSINSSPRILKNSDTKNHKHKSVRGSGFSGRINSCSEITSNSHGPNDVVGNVGTEGPVKKIDTVMVGLNASPDESDQQRLNNGEGGHSDKNEQSKLGNSEVLESFGRKRGRIKQKKLPLSVCNFRDQTGLKEGGNSVGINGGLFSSGSNLIPDERTSTSMWKCQSLKVTACVKPTKVMQL